MNANELADYLQNKAEAEHNPRLQEAATMFRQLQTEIEKIEKLMNFWKESYNELRSLNG